MAIRTLTRTGNRGTRHDVAESVLRRMDTSTERTTSVSLFHLLSLAAIGTSIYLFMKGKRMEAIFVGLWPPTFEALKAAAERQ